MSGNVFPVPKLQFFDDDGDPLAGGKVSFFAAGTTTPLDTFSDSGLTTANTNPVILDAAGRATIYASPLAYKVVVKTSADVLISTNDNVFGNALGTDGVTLTGTQTLTNKTLTSPTINTPTIATPTITGATITSPTITNPTISGQTPVSVTAATVTLGPTHVGRTTVFNRAAGIAATLPAATGTGNRYEIVIGTTFTGAASIAVPNATDYMIGTATLFNDGADTVVGFATANTGTVATESDTISLFGTANSQGGIKGARIVLTDIATAIWAVQYVSDAGGTEATPFSAAV